MNWNDFIYKAVYDGCIKAGIDVYESNVAAESAKEDYKRNKFTKPSKLVDEKIKQAKKIFKQSKEKKK